MKKQKVDRLDEFLQKSATLHDESGATVDAPEAGKQYTIRMRPRLKFAGDRQYIIDALAKRFEGATFIWG